MMLQNGMLIQLTEKNQYKDVITTNALVLRQVTEEHPWYFYDCKYYQYLIIMNNTIKFLGYLSKPKSWCIVEPSGFYFEGDKLKHISYCKVKTKFLEETTNKWKLLRKPPPVRPLEYFRDQYNRALASKTVNNNNCI